jgi:hypothetical protein
MAYDDLQYGRVYRRVGPVRTRHAPGEVSINALWRVLADSLIEEKHDHSIF